MRYLDRLVVAVLGLGVITGAGKPHAEAPYASDGADGIYPEPKLTPGAVDPKATAKDVCKHGYTAKVRDVDEATKRAVFGEYGIDYAKHHAEYEVDHFVSLELGGSNDPRNLWPEPYAGVAYTARMKDQVENHLHGRVCAGKLALAAAQDAIRKDWVAVYSQCCRGKGK